MLGWRLSLSSCKNRKVPAVSRAGSIILTRVGKASSLRQDPCDALPSACQKGRHTPENRGREMGDDDLHPNTCSLQKDRSIAPTNRLASGLLFFFKQTKSRFGGSDLLSRGKPTIIGLGVFHFRVRYGIGWGNSGIAATKAAFWILYCFSKT